MTRTASTRHRRVNAMGTAALLVGLLVVGMTVTALAQETDAEAATPRDASPGEKGLIEANEFVRQGKYPEAAAVLSELVGEATDDVRLLALYGEVLLATGEAGQAVPNLERALEIDPERARLHFQLGTALASLGRLEPALESFARELEISEDSQIRFMCRLNRSIVLERLRRWSDAAGEIEQAIEIQPDSATAYGDLARLYMNADRVEDAVGALERGESAGFRSADLYFNLGARLYNDREYDRAEAFFRKTLEVRPDMAEAERGLGSTLSRMGKTDEALEHFDRYLELEPDAPDAREIREQLKAAR